MHEEEDYLMRALAVGVRGYLLKESAQTDLVPAVRMVATGKTYFSVRPWHEMLADDFGRIRCSSEAFQHSYDLLTGKRAGDQHPIDRGREIEQRGCGGTLGLSPYTVETHRTHIMQKLDLHNTAEIVLYAVRKKIIV